MASPPPHVLAEAPARCGVTGADTARLSAMLMRSALAGSRVAPDGDAEARAGAALDHARAHKAEDAVQGGLASLSVALFNAAVDVLGRAAGSRELPPPVAAQMAGVGAKLALAHVAMLDAIERRRAGGVRQVVQKICIERIEGGAQAVIGVPIPDREGGLRGR